MFKIDNEKEFISFLKILAEESVKKSKKQINESPDELSSSFQERLSAEKELYEQEDEEAESDPELDAGNNDEPEPESSKEEEVADTETETETDVSDSPENKEELRASLDSLERNINSLRAGKSLKDSTIESQLEIYFDRLGEDEKSLMVLFIRELSKILSGEVSGNAAVDPNDDPYKLDVVQMSGEEETPTPSQETPAEDPDPPEEDIDEEEEEEEEEEDTSPPIKVGTEPQNLAEIRKRINKLMSK